MAFCTGMPLALYFDVLLTHNNIAIRLLRKVAMNQRMLLIAMLLPVIAGCESYSWSVYNNPSITDVKQGEDCRVLVFGLGGSVDPTGIQAMRLGGMTKVRSTVYRVNTLQGVGNECVIAHGE
jgi:hypothetical protein